MPNEREQGGFGEPERVTAGQYVKHVLLVVGLLLLGIAAFSMAHAQEVSGCRSFAAVIAKSLPALEQMKADEAKIEYGMIDKSQVQPMLKELSKAGAEIPEVEDMDTMFYASFPDGSTVLVLGAGGCIKGYMKVPAEEWKAIIGVVALGDRT